MHKVVLILLILSLPAIGFLCGIWYASDLYQSAIAFNAFIPTENIGEKIEIQKLQEKEMVPPNEDSN